MTRQLRAQLDTIAGIVDPDAKREGIYVEVGDLIADKYRVERVIGEGGMAFVVRARHLQLDEPVALKFLKKEFLAQPDIKERFAREARASSRIKNDHVARVYDVGVFEGTPYLVMEYLDGKDLFHLVEESGPLSIEAAVEYVMQACEALAAAHAQGIVHRDIKPDNLFLVRRGEGLGQVKVLDFGISKVSLTGKAFDSFDEGEERLTGMTALGTPLYMSPEQIRSTSSVDQRTDVWSLGVVLYEILTGKPPFEAPTVTEMCAAVLEQDPTPVNAVRPDIPLGLASAIECCMKKNVDERFANVGELAVALLPYAPKRARLSAERACSALGIKPLMSSVAPPAMDDASPLSGRNDIETLPPAEAELAPPAPKRARDGRPLLIAAVVLIAIAAIAFAAREKFLAKPPPPAPVAAPAPPPPATTAPVATATATPTATETATATATAASTAAPTAAAPKRPTTVRKPTTTKPGTRGTATPAGGAPDLGY